MIIPNVNWVLVILDGTGEPLVLIFPTLKKGYKHVLNIYGLELRIAPVNGLGQRRYRVQGESKTGGAIECDVDATLTQVRQ